MNDKQQTAVTPKEKAKELVDKFYTNRSKDDLPLTMYWSSAIGCALIAVDEILDVCKRQLLNTVEKPYWQQVKQEIEKL